MKNIIFYNGKIKILILLSIFLLFIFAGVIITYLTFINNNWNYLIYCCSTFTFAIMIAIFLVNKNHDLIVNFKQKELSSNIHFNKEEKFTLLFENIQSVKIVEKDEIKKHICKKRLPKQAIYVATKDNIVKFIPLTWFSDKQKKSIITTLMNIKSDDYEIIY